MDINEDHEVVSGIWRWYERLELLRTKEVLESWQSADLFYLPVVLDDKFAMAVRRNI